MLDKKARGVSSTRLQNSLIMCQLIYSQVHSSNGVSRKNIMPEHQTAANTLKAKNVLNTIYEDEALQPPPNCLARTRTYTHDTHTKISDGIDFKAMLLPQL